MVLQRQNATLRHGMAKSNTLKNQVFSSAILRRTADISRMLNELAIPHVLVGGLEVGIHGHPRSTKDVDFMVGSEAFASTTPFLV